MTPWCHCRLDSCVSSGDASISSGTSEESSLLHWRNLSWSISATRKDKLLWLRAIPCKCNLCASLHLSLLCVKPACPSLPCLSRTLYIACQPHSVVLILSLLVCWLTCQQHALTFLERLLTCLLIYSQLLLAVTCKKWRSAICCHSLLMHTLPVISLKTHFLLSVSHAPNIRLYPTRIFTLCLNSCVSMPDRSQKSPLLPFILYEPTGQ